MLVLVLLSPLGSGEYLEPVLDLSLVSGRLILILPSSLGSGEYLEPVLTPSLVSGRLPESQSQPDSARFRQSQPETESSNVIQSLSESARF